METLNIVENIKKSIGIFLDMENLKYEIREDNDKNCIFHLDLGYDHGSLGFYVDYDIQSKLIHFLCYTHQSIPEKGREEVQKFYSVLNQNLTYWSSIHLRPDNGVTFSKSTILLDDLEDVSLNVINRHFGINYHNLNNFYSEALKIGLALIDYHQALEELRTKFSKEE